MYRVTTNSQVAHAERSAELVTAVWSNHDIGMLVIDDEANTSYLIFRAGTGYTCLASLAQPGTIQPRTLTPGATVTPDLGGNGAVFFTLNVDRDCVIANPINAPANALFWIKYVQGAGAPWVPTHGNAYKHQSGGIDFATIQGHSDTAAYLWDGSTAAEIGRGSDVG